MKQNERARILGIATLLCMVALKLESTGAVVPYDRLTPPQKDAFSSQLEKVGMSMSQAMQLLESNQLIKVELPTYRRCPDCRGSGQASFLSSKASGKAICSYCNGGGRIQKRVTPSYSYDDSKKQRLGTVQSDVQYEFENCPHCGGTGRVTAYVCGTCGGNGQVIYGNGAYIVGPSITANQKGLIGKEYELLRLVNGKELRSAKVIKIAGDDIEIRHASGLGKFKREDFNVEDAGKLFGVVKSETGVSLAENVLDLTISDANTRFDTEIEAVDQNTEWISGENADPGNNAQTADPSSRVTKGGDHENGEQLQEAAELGPSGESRSTKLQTKAFIPNSPHYVGLISSGYRDLLTGDEIAWGSTPEQVQGVCGPIALDSGDLWDPEANPNATTYVQTYKNRKMLERAFKFDAEGLFQVYAKYNASQISDDEMVKNMVALYGPAKREYGSENMEGDPLDTYVWNTCIYPHPGYVSLRIRYTLFYNPIGYVVDYFDVKSMSRGRKMYSE